MVAVVQREWAAKNPRATIKDPITVDDVLNSRMIAYPFRLLKCCLVTDGGGALILTSRRPREGFSDASRSISWAPARASRRRWSARWRTSPPRAPSASPGRRRSSEAGITHKDVDHLMIYDAFAHLPLYGLEDLGFMPPGEAARVHRRAQHGARRQAAAEHQWRRAVLHALGHVRHVRAAGERAADARHRAGAGARARRFRSATASAACSPLAARSSSATRRRSGFYHRHGRA